MDEYIAWDYSAPGISFNVGSGRITIFKTTLEAIGYPEHFRFLFSPDGGAHRLPEIVKRDHYDIKSKDLVRFVFQSCGWAKKLTYRVPGVRKAPDSHTVYFDLQQALEVHEGRTRVAQQ